MMMLGPEIKHSGWENAGVIWKIVVLYSKKALFGKTNIMEIKESIGQVNLTANLDS